MKKKHGLLVAATFLILFVGAHQLAARFGNAKRAFVTTDGKVLTTDLPLYPWVVYIWPALCVVAGIAAALVMNASFRRPVRMFGAVLISFLVVYGLASVFVFFDGLSGFLGLLMFHGTEVKSSPTGISLLVCPILIIVGVLALCLIRRVSIEDNLGATSAR